jgi:hypothetical protein
VKSPDQEWRMLSAFLGWVNRHFGDRVTAGTIKYSWHPAAISLARLRLTMTDCGACRVAGEPSFTTRPPDVDVAGST